MGVPGAIGDIQPFAELASRPDSVVYKAYQRSLERVVLLKVVRHSSDDDPDALRRFAEGARLVARVQHPNVVAVFDYGEIDGQAYMVSEFVEGTDVAQILQHGPLSPDLALFVLHEVALGLDAAHRKGVLHRDIKPANILLSDEGQVRLADFGMASLLDEASEASEVRGTIAYLSPEQILGNGADARSDLFSLGATFVEMLTGRQAFTGAGAGALMDAVLHTDPIRLLDSHRDVPGAIRDITRRLLEKTPENRFASAAELVRAIESTGDLPNAASAAERLRARVQNPAEPELAIAGPAALALPRPPQPSPAPAIVTGSMERRAPSRLRRVTPIGAAVLLVAVAFAAANGLRRDAIDDATNSATLDVPVETRVQPTESTTDPTIPPNADDEKAAADEDDLGAEATRNNAAEMSLSGSPEIADAEGTLETPPETLPDAITEAGTSTATQPATLGIVVDPWADIFVDGSHVARGRSHELTLAPGAHEIRLEHPDFASQTQRVVLESGSRESLTLSLSETMGSLVVLAWPWAEIDIDGERNGVVPRADPFLLTPGAHRITLRNPALGARRDTLVSITRGKTFTLRVGMDDGQ